ncbi:hypothetical protein E3P86_01090, partial [Wallemia ichthyophaga]
MTRVTSTFLPIALILTLTLEWAIFKFTLAGYTHIFPQFAGAGYKVFAFDQRGFGRSTHEKIGNPKPGLTNWKLALGDIQNLIFKFSEQNVGLPLFLMGHSMGGGLTLGALTRNPHLKLPELKGAIAMSPLIRLTKPPPNFLISLVNKCKGIVGSFTISPMINPEDRTHDKVVQNAIEEDALAAKTATLGGVCDMLRYGSLLISQDYKFYPSNVPLLISHGDSDNLNSFEASKLFIDSVMARSKQLKRYPNARHELFMEAGELKYEVVRDVITWLDGVLELYSIQGSACIVTGGASGLGYIVSQTLVQNGAKTLYITSRKVDQLKQATHELQKLSPSCAVKYIPADLSSKAGVDVVVDHVKAREERIDILVNNSGATWGAKLEDFPEKKGFDNIMALNVKATFYMIVGLADLLAKGKSNIEPAHVVNVSSVAGVVTSAQSGGLVSPDAGSWSYGASKAALNHLTKTLAQTLSRKHIMINAVLPSVFETRMTRHAVADHMDELL